MTLCTFLRLVLMENLFMVKLMKHLLKSIHFQTIQAENPFCCLEKTKVTRICCLEKTIYLCIQSEITGKNNGKSIFIFL